MTPTPHTPTQESIAFAKAAAAAEREFDALSHVVYMPHVKTVTICCPKCSVTATALSEGRAVAILAKHLIASHAIAPQVES